MFFLPEKTHIVLIWRRQERASAIEKPIEPRVQRLRLLVYRRCSRVLHHVTQLVFRARVEQIERVVFQCSVNTRLPHEHMATFRQSRIAQLFHAVERRQLRLEVSLQIPLRDGGRIAFRKIKPGCGKPGDDESHRQK